MRRGKITKRLDAKWLAFGKPPSWRYPATKFGELTIAEPGYGSGARATTMQTGLEPRYIRITDFDDDGIPDDNEYTTPEVVEADCFLEANDMLFARSGATVGKTYLHQDVSHPAIFAGYCIRFRFDVGKVLPLYAWFFTKTAAFSHWVQTIQRPSGQPNINKQEFKSVELPLPPLVKQRELVDAMETARTARRTKLAEADALLAGLDQYLLDTL
ncbi:MAG: restriction endonuclease subunit S, partial [Gammaproteobacteria bacterium]